MSLTDPHTLTALANDVLVARIGSLTARARESTADLIGHLVELERRNLHLALGFRSLFFYCRSLDFSEAESYTRMEVAQVARRFPVILPLLADGRLHLTAVRLLGPHLRDEDHLALLGGALRRSRREIDLLLARWFPRPDIPAKVRKLPPLRSAGPAAPARLEGEVAGPPGPATGAETANGRPTGPETTVADAKGSESGSPETGGAETPSPGDVRPSAAPRRRGTVIPFAPARYKVEFMAGEATIAKLRRAQELLSHSIPDGDLEAIFDRALDLVVAEASRTRHSALKRAKEGTGGNGASGGTGGPGGGRPGARPARPTADRSRSLAAEVERVVWERDGGQCAFVGIDGRRCEERKRLEFHHLRPWAVGGPPTVENIALRCRAHNRYEADVYFKPIRDARSAGM